MTRSRCRLPALFLVLLLLACASVAHAKEMVAAVRDSVQLRSGPNARAPVRWTVDRGYPLQVLGRRGAWLHVRDFENDRGWVLSSRINRTPHAVPTGTVLKLRSQPGSGARTVAKANYGDVLRILDRRSGWLKVRNRAGTVGWVPSASVWGF